MYRSFSTPKASSPTAVWTSMARTMPPALAPGHFSWISPASGSEVPTRPMLLKKAAGMRSGRSSYPSLYPDTAWATMSRTMSYSSDPSGVLLGNARPLEAGLEKGDLRGFGDENVFLRGLVHGCSRWWV